ncbi:MAG: ribonuclease J [Gammaproteobacteria bacterium]|nr:MAG: ribonuclease J [Gammaproteobacteria bacterium]
MQPDSRDFWFLPLGGTGEIGMNLNLYGHAGRWLMVDCGVTFAKEGQPGPHVQMADPAFITARRKDLVALLVTHAHEDHVGAVAHLWRRLRCPVITSRFTAAVLARKLAEAGLTGRVPITEVEAGARIDVGPFNVEWLRLTHSIPEAHALMIRTPVARVLHTGDWKLDPDPVVGAAPVAARFQALAEEGIDAMVCDSTNAMVSGHSISEGALRPGLEKVVAEATGRVIVTAFGSNIARLHTLAQVAKATGRHFTVLGRSLENMVAAARTSGLWRPERDPVSAAELGYLPRHEILVVATGSQGDPGAALDRLARATHPVLELEAGDRVVFSSRVIPGNERTLERLMRQLERRRVDVVTAEDALIHASGHPCEDELRTLYGWVQPRIAIPVHGEPPHLGAHARIARSCGVPVQLVGRNGDLFMIAPVPGMRPDQAPCGRIGLGSEGLETLPCQRPERPNMSRSVVSE